ncbi:MAG: hypothetical protein M3208_00150 [Thermoproteota archaeon]|jgi:hypothetical protein|nr:hypothetical protein [Thermoproteota archaeon]
MIDPKNDKKNNNHTVSAATIFTLAIIMMTALTIAYPAAATTATTMPQPVTVATDNQSVNVLVSWEPAEIEPGGDTEFTLEFQDPSSGEPIDHVNYDFEIMDQNGETVQSMTDLHTHSGSDEQTVTFDTPGSFNLVTTIIGTGIDPPFDTSQSGTAQTVIPVGQQLAGATEGGTPGTGNATTAGTGGNQSDVRMNLEQALMALQSNDTQSAMTFLDMALSALGGNATTTAGATNATAALGGTTAEGGATGGEGGGGGAEGEEGEGGEEGGTD